MNDDNPPARSADRTCTRGAGLYPDRPITVSVVSDHPIVVAGIRALLQEDPDRTYWFTFVSESGEADVVIFDVFNLAIDPDSGELQKLVASHPDRVLALSRLLQPALTARALAVGAVAPVSIGADRDELLALLHSTACGAFKNDPDLARQNLADLARRLGADVGLTKREQTVVALIAAGYSNEQIARHLYVSINTVKSNIRSAYSRIGARTRAQAVAWAIEHGYGDSLGRE